MEKERGYVTSSALKEYQGEYGPIIDLGLGTSPIGPTKEIRQPLRERDPFWELAKYPEDPLHLETRQLLLDGIGIQGLGSESVIFDGNGSYGAGDEIIRFLKNQGYDKVLVPVYSFPNVSQWAVRHKVEYIPVSPRGDDLNPLSSVKQMLEFEDLAGFIVYLDYPNNPFGIANPELTRKLVDHVANNGGVPVIDLAFGEVLGEEFRMAIQYTVDNGGIALGSLSKTQGLPGLRTGYAILPRQFTENGYNGGERLVFGLNREAEYVYNLLFSPLDNENGDCLAKIHARRVAEYNQTTNAYLYQRLQQLGLTVAPTDLRTPIQVIISNRKDFYERLRKVGIITESLADYKITLPPGIIRYENSAIRMLTPRPDQIEEVVRRIEVALTLL